MIFIVSKLLQAMLIIAWRGVSPVEIFQRDMLYYLSSTFITAAVLRLLQSTICLFFCLRFEVKALYSHEKKQNMKSNFFVSLSGVVPIKTILTLHIIDIRTSHHIFIRYSRSCSELSWIP